MRIPCLVLRSSLPPCLVPPLARPAPPASTLVLVLTSVVGSKSGPLRPDREGPLWARLPWTRRLARRVGRVRGGCAGGGGGRCWTSVASPLCAPLMFRPPCSGSLSLCGGLVRCVARVLAARLRRALALVPCRLRAGMSGCAAAQARCGLMLGHCHAVVLARLAVPLPLAAVGRRFSRALAGMVRWRARCGAPCGRSRPRGLAVRGVARTPRAARRRLGGVWPVPRRWQRGAWHASVRSRPLDRPPAMALLPGRRGGVRAPLGALPPRRRGLRAVGGAHRRQARPAPAAARRPSWVGGRGGCPGALWRCAVAPMGALQPPRPPRGRARPFDGCVGGGLPFVGAGYRCRPVPEDGRARSGVGPPPLVRGRPRLSRSLRAARGPPGPLRLASRLALALRGDRPGAVAVSGGPGALCAGGSWALRSPPRPTPAPSRRG